MAWHDKGHIDDTRFALERPGDHDRMCESSVDFHLMIHCTAHDDTVALGDHTDPDFAELHSIFNGNEITESQRTKIIHLGNASKSAHVAKPRVQRVFKQMKKPLASVQRLISSPRGLRSLFVTSTMFQKLLGDIDTDAKATGSMGAKSWPIIDITIFLRDGNMRDWPVAFNTYFSSRQYHRCLRTGWSHFCTANNVCVGDIVNFRRLSEKGIILHAQVIHACK